MGARCAVKDSALLYFLVGTAPDTTLTKQYMEDLGAARHWTPALSSNGFWQWERSRTKHTPHRDQQFLAVVKMPNGCTQCSVIFLEMLPHPQKCTTLRMY